MRSRSVSNRRGSRSNLVRGPCRDEPALPPFDPDRVDAVDPPPPEPLLDEVVDPPDEAVDVVPATVLKTLPAIEPPAAVVLLTTSPPPELPEPPELVAWSMVSCAVATTWSVVELTVSTTSDTVASASGSGTVWAAAGVPSTSHAASTNPRHAVRLIAASPIQLPQLPQLPQLEPSLLRGGRNPLRASLAAE
jgi:hypothetical protein